MIFEESNDGSGAIAASVMALVSMSIFVVVGNADRLGFKGTLAKVAMSYLHNKYGWFILATLVLYADNRRAQA